MSKLSLAQLLVVCVVSWSSVAWAGPATADPLAPDREAELIRLNEEGAAHFESGEYRQAVERFIQALAIDDDPNLFFNIANCYERLGDPEAAMEKYQDFLDSPRGDPGGRPRAERALARLRAAGGQAPPQAVQAEASRHPAPVEVQDGSPEPLVPWLALGGGATLAVAGVALYWMGHSDHAEVSDADGYGDATRPLTMTRRRADALVDSGSRKKAFGVAGLAAEGGFAQVSVVPAVGAPGLSFSGAF